MNTMEKLLILSLLACLPLVAQLPDAEPLPVQSPISGSISTTVSSDYIWRGILGDSNASLFSDVTLSYNDFFVSYWNYIAMASRGNGLPRLGEHDFIIGYTYNNLTFSFTEYQFPKYEDTREVSISSEIPSPVGDLVLFSAYDTEIQGAYSNISYSYTYTEPSTLVSLTPWVSVGFGSEKYNEYYFGEHKYDFNDISVGLSAEKTSDALTYSGGVTYTENAGFELNSSITVSAGISYSF